jgi:hypothetical protein
LVGIVFFIFLFAWLFEYNMILYYFKRTHAYSNTTWCCITIKEHMLVRIQHDFVLL